MAKRDTKVQTQVYLNADDDSFFGYQRGQRLATHADLTFTVVEQATPGYTAEEVFAIGNRMGKDTERRTWPDDVRSVSVGDVVRVGGNWLTVDRFGFKTIEPPHGDHLVELAGQERLTSRKAGDR